NILAIGITKGFPAFTNQFVERPRVAKIFPLRFATWPNNVNGVAKISLALLLGLRGTKIVVCDEFQQGGILRKRSAHLIDRDVRCSRPEVCAAFADLAFQTIAVFFQGWQTGLMLFGGAILRSTQDPASQVRTDVIELIEELGVARVKMAAQSLQVVGEQFLDAAFALKNGGEREVAGSLLLRRETHIQRDGFIELRNEKLHVCKFLPFRTCTKIEVDIAVADGHGTSKRFLRARELALRHLKYGEIVELFDDAWVSGAEGLFTNRQGLVVERQGLRELT